jgi:hypothetical protein
MNNVQLTVQIFTKETFSSNDKKDHTLWAPPHKFPLSHGQQFTIYGQKATQFYNLINQINNTTNNNLIVQYYGPIIEQQMGSIQFNGNDNCGIQTPINNCWNLNETTDFTIEWFEYNTPNKKNQIRFSLDEIISLSYEKVFLFQQNGKVLYQFSENQTFNNKWMHFAICRKNQNIYFYQNGSIIYSDHNSVNVQNPTKLTIGNLSNLNSINSYAGNITNFHCVIGTALYDNNNFSPTIEPIISIQNTKLLLLANTQTTKLQDYSSINQNLLSNNITWSNNTPFNFN